MWQIARNELLVTKPWISKGKRAIGAVELIIINEGSLQNRRQFKKLEIYYLIYYVYTYYGTVMVLQITWSYILAKI